MATAPDTPPRVLFSASEEYFPQAEHDLIATFPGSVVERLGPDIGALSAPENSALAEFESAKPEPVNTKATYAHTVAAACRAATPVFVRHLADEQHRCSRTEAADPGEVAAAAVTVVRRTLAPGAELAVQAWVSGESPTTYGSRELFERTRTALEATGYDVRRAGTAYVLALCLHPKGVSLGLTPATAALRDWPGGRVRLAKSRQQVSRSEFKLEELFATMADELPSTGRAVDLGASPGGWSRILRTRGYEVWAVDPGDLHPRVAADPMVHHERTTAGSFLDASRSAFDLAVNDMRMDPMRSAETMLRVRQRLRPGAAAVVTLKLGTRRPGTTARHALDLLGGGGYEVRYAGQLHHNRQEITVLAHVPGAVS